MDLGLEVTESKCYGEATGGWPKSYSVSLAALWRINRRKVRVEGGEQAVGYCGGLGRQAGAWTWWEWYRWRIRGVQDTLEEMKIYIT